MGFNPGAFLQALRMNSIFSPGMILDDNTMPSQPVGQYAPTTPSVPDLPMSEGGFQGPTMNRPLPVELSLAPDSYNPEADYTANYHPQYDAENRLRDVLGQYPQEQKHSKLGRLGAALLSGWAQFNEEDQGGKTLGQNIKLGTDVLDMPRQRRVADWKEQVTPLYQAANLERQNNIAEANAARNMVNSKITERKNEETARIQGDRNKIFAMKQANPNYKFNSNGPTIRVEDPATGQSYDTGILTGRFSDAEKMLLNHINRASEIAQRTGNAPEDTPEQIRARQKQDLDEAAWSVPYFIPDPEHPDEQMEVQRNQRTGQLRINPGPGAEKHVHSGVKMGTERQPSPDAAAKPPNPDLIRKTRNMRAHDLITQKPWLKDWFIFDDKGNVDIKEAIDDPEVIKRNKWNWLGSDDTGPTMKQRKELWDMITAGEREAEMSRPRIVNTNPYQPRNTGQQGGGSQDNAPHPGADPNKKGHWRTTPSGIRVWEE